MSNYFWKYTIIVHKKPSLSSKYSHHIIIPNDMVRTATTLITPNNLSTKTCIHVNENEHFVSTQRLE